MAVARCVCAVVVFECAVRAVAEHEEAAFALCRRRLVGYDVYVFYIAGDFADGNCDCVFFAVPLEFCRFFGGLSVEFYDSYCGGFECRGA